jgi:hypothetical protein
MRSASDKHAVVTEDESVWWWFSGEAVPRAGEYVRKIGGEIYRVTDVLWFIGDDPEKPVSARVTVVLDPEVS